jgi:hypothetical protein
MLVIASFDAIKLNMVASMLHEARAGFVPAGIQTFAKAEDRARLSAPAVKAFRALVERWQLSNAEAAGLLGISESTWDRIKRGTWGQPLSQDQLTRASAAIGLYKGLHLLFADAMADIWPKRANKGPIYGGLSPVEAMIEGGIPVMLEARRHIDAVRGGL